MRISSGGWRQVDRAGGNVMTAAATFAVQAPPSSAKPTSVEAQLRLWQDQFEERTPEQMLPAYAFHNDEQSKLAWILSQEAVAGSRIVKMARQKWGDQAESRVAHALCTDTRSDDAKANVVYVGEHATVSFTAGTIDPLLLVRENGHWLIDVPGYLKLNSADIPGTIRDTQKIADAVQKIQADLADGKYVSLDALVADINSQIPSP
jgi:hypothetical protein